MIQHPWMSSMDAEMVLSFLSRMRDPVVVEYGAGWSTVHFSKIAKMYITVEMNGEWANIIGENVGRNVTILRCPSDLQPRTYASLPFENVSNTPVDLAIVDGTHREAVVDYLRDNNLAKVVLLHDAHRGSPAMEKFHYNAKIGSDFFIGMHQHPDESLAVFLEKYLARPMNWPSIPWDKTHVGVEFTNNGRPI